MTLSDPDHSSANTLNIQISNTIRNPRTFKATGSITISTYDSSDNLIDTGSGFSATMDTMNTFTFIGANLLTNKINGGISDYLITLTIAPSGVPVHNGDIL